MDIAHSVRLAHNVRVLEDRLVRVEAIDPQAYVEDDVIEGEFVHDVTRDVNGLVSTNGAGVVLIVAERSGFIEEVLNGWAPSDLVAVGIVPAVVHVVGPLVQQVVCTKHVQTEEFRIDGVDVDQLAVICP